MWSVATTGGPSPASVQYCQYLYKKDARCKARCQLARKHSICKNDCKAIIDASKSKICPAQDRWSPAKCEEFKNKGSCKEPKSQFDVDVSQQQCAKTCGNCVAQNSDLHCKAETGWLCEEHEAKYKKYCATASAKQVYEKHCIIHYCDESGAQLCESLLPKIAACEKFEKKKSG